jgi:hypothetical protein
VIALPEEADEVAFLDGSEIYSRVIDLRKRR